MLAALLIASVLPTDLPASSLPEQFARGNERYKEKEYRKAIESYTGIVEQGVESAPLYFNLGNAYFKDGDLGRAILYYMKARRLAPGDDDIINNLDFARQFTSIRMEGVKLNPVTSFAESVVDPYHLNTLAWISSICFVFLLLMLILRFVFGIDASVIRVGVVVGVILLVAASSVTTFKYRHEYLTRRAVLLDDESPVYAGPSEELDVEFEGAPGLVVEILSESGDFCNVLFENKRRGWIRKELVAEI
jgi:tetratricopeptide (TPR) repeat protein